ncbi:MAG: hypothetical protein ACR2RE_15980 [Geminicoccaceae bacterium]
MPAEHEHPTPWEKLRDNLTPVIAMAIGLGLWNMHTTQVEFKAEVTSTLWGIEHRVGRLENRLDRLIENGTEER